MLQIFLILFSSFQCFYVNVLRGFIHISWNQHNYKFCLLIISFVCYLSFSSSVYLFEHSSTNASDNLCKWIMKCSIWGHHLQLIIYRCYLFEFFWFYTVISIMNKFPFNFDGPIIFLVLIDFYMEMVWYSFRI